MQNLFLCVGALILAGLFRVTPHLANITPFFGVALAVGYLLNLNLRTAIFSTVVIMGLSDAVVGFHWTAPFVYAGLAFATWAGARSRNLTRQRGIVGSVFVNASVSALSSIVFFAVSNIGVWFVGELYPMNLSGLLECFTLAIPFFRSSLASDLMFGTVLLTAAAKYVAYQKVSAKVLASRSSNVSVANG